MTQTKTSKKTEEEYLEWCKLFWAEFEKFQHLSSLRKPMEWWLFIHFSDNFTPEQAVELLFDD